MICLATPARVTPGGNGACAGRSSNVSATSCAGEAFSIMKRHKSREKLRRTGVEMQRAEDLFRSMTIVRPGPVDRFTRDTFIVVSRHGDKPFGRFAPRCRPGCVRMLIANER